MGRHPLQIRVSRSAGRSAVALAKFFGYVEHRHRPGGFFSRHSAQELEWIWHDLRVNYLRMLKLAHPDNGGNHAVASLLTSSWNKLSRAFAWRCPNIPVKLPDPRPERRRLKKRRKRAPKVRIEPTRTNGRWVMTPKRAAALRLGPLSQSRH